MSSPHDVIPIIAAVRIIVADKRRKLAQQIKSLRETCELERSSRCALELGAMIPTFDFVMECGDLKELAALIDEDTEQMECMRDACEDVLEKIAYGLALDFLSGIRRDVHAARMTS